MDDHELWGPIRGRDASAEAFYRDNAARLCAFLRQLVGSPQAAEDLMQETFTHMWKSPNGFRPRAREWQPQGSPGVETVVQKKSGRSGRAKSIGGCERQVYGASERRLALTNALRSAAIFAATLLSSSAEGSRDSSKRSAGA